jgi:predicted membrane metal-binding protein
MQLLKFHFHLINIPPLLAMMICFMIGIIGHSSSPFFIAIFVMVISVYGVSYFKHISLPKKFIFYSLFALLGAWLPHKELQDYHHFYSLIENKKFTATGTVIDISQAIVNHRKTTAITLALDTITTGQLTQRSNKVMLFYGKGDGDIVVGDTITFLDLRCKKPASENFQRYQIKEQIAATIFNDNFTYRIDHHPTWSLRHWIWNQKTRLLHALQNKLSIDGFNFFSSLFLGNRACIKNELEETNELFKTWGISHFLARSGLHLVLFIFLCQALFCIMPLPMIAKQIIMSLLSIIYFVLTWTSAPFTRSFALFMLNKICFFNKAPFHLLHYLTLVCFGFLLYCPLYLFFLDFQLSFALTGALAWFNQVTQEHKSQ